MNKIFLFHIKDNLIGFGLRRSYIECIVNKLALQHIYDQ